MFTTGHLGTDPRLGRAIKAGALELVAEVGSPTDKARVVLAEMNIWNKSDVFPLAELPSHLPNAPAPESRGGSDLEQTAAELNDSSPGHIIIFSAGESQVPSGTPAATLLGGTGRIPGFAEPHRFLYDLSAYGESRSMLVTIYLKQNAFHGREARTAFQYPTSGNRQPQAADNPTVLTPRENAGTRTSLPWPLLLGGAVVTSGIGFGLARLSAKGQNSEPSSGSADLEAWKTEATRLRKQLDLIAQDLHEAASEHAQGEDAAKISLRQDVARRDRSLETWDEIAIDFLDGLDRVLQHHGPNSPEGESAQRIAFQFSRHIQRAGLDTINPNAGDVYVPGLHSIEEIVVAMDEREIGTVSKVIRLGFRRGEHVIRQAKIVMSERNQ